MRVEGDGDSGGEVEKSRLSSCSKIPSYSNIRPDRHQGFVSRSTNKDRVQNPCMFQKHSTTINNFDSPRRYPANLSTSSATLRPHCDHIDPHKELHPTLISARRAFLGSIHFANIRSPTSNRDIFNRQTPWAE